MERDARGRNEMKRVRKKMEELEQWRFRDIYREI